jgi:hypothetical protein
MWWGPIAEGQHGLVTWDQGVEAVGPDRMGSEIRAGRLVRERPGVYAVAGAPRSRQRDVLAVCLTTGGVASHRSAAWLHGFGLTSFRPEITTLPGARVRLPGVLAHRSTVLPPEHLTVVSGIPCTTPARTALDMSARLGDESLELMLHWVHQHRIVSYAEVIEVLGELRRRGRRRVAHLAPILDKCIGAGEKSESRGELWVVRTLVGAGLPVPAEQIWVVANGHRYCIDVGYVPERVGIEFDGWGAHGVTRSAFDGDRDKISELELAGWLMLPVTSATTSSVLVDRVQRALALRRPTSGQPHAILPVSVQKSEGLQESDGLQEADGLQKSEGLRKSEG